MNAIENVSRRGFLKVAGITSGSFVLGMNLPITSAQAKSSAAGLSHELNFFVSIALSLIHI